MARAPQISTKRLAIGKANAQMVIVVGVASFVTVFCLVASKTVFSQNRYQAKVTSAQEKAHQQLLTNLKNFNSLKSSYAKFDGQTTNIIGGSSTGTNTNDGPNSTIVLDALPDTYNFPALTSSLEKVLSGTNLKITSISGTDDQLTQQGNQATANPQPVSMPFSFSVSNANYSSVAQLMSILQQSIRPIQIDTIDMSGAANDMTVTVTAHTYYQPAKTVSISKETIK